MFRPAGVGHGAKKIIEHSIRNDETYWIDLNFKDDGALSQATPRSYVFEDIARRFSDLKTALNRTLYLAIWELEAHFAIYPPGGYYRKHRDCFSNNDSRVISIVLYLNENWEKSHGGELLIYCEKSGNHQTARIEPRAGTLVCFFSDQIEHEVLASQNVSRYSLTGWFRRREIK